MKRINRYLFSFDYRQIYKEIEVVITREMDLSQEAKSLVKMTHLFKSEKNIIFPAVHKEFCKRSILVTEFIEGMKISETLAIRYKGKKKSRPLSLLLRVLEALHNLSSGSEVNSSDTSGIYSSLLANLQNGSSVYEENCTSLP